MATNEQPDLPPEGEHRSPERIEFRLRQLRALVRSSVAARGVAIILMVLAGLVLVSFGLDRLFRLSIPGRAVALAVYVCGAAWASWKLLLKPLLLRIPDRILADILERHFRELEDALRSAIDFMRHPTLFSASSTSESD